MGSYGGTNWYIESIAFDGVHAMRANLCVIVQCLRLSYMVVMNL